MNPDKEKLSTVTTCVCILWLMVVVAAVKRNHLKEFNSFKAKQQFCQENELQGIFYDDLNNLYHAYTTDHAYFEHKNRRVPVTREYTFEYSSNKSTFKNFKYTVDYDDDYYGFVHQAGIYDVTNDLYAEVLFNKDPKQGSYPLGALLFVVYHKYSSNRDLYVYLNSTKYSVGDKDILEERCRKCRIGNSVEQNMTSLVRYFQSYAEDHLWFYVIGSYWYLNRQRLEFLFETKTMHKLIVAELNKNSHLRKSITFKFIFDRFVGIIPYKDEHYYVNKYRQHKGHYLIKKIVYDDLQYKAEADRFDFQETFGCINLNKESDVVFEPEFVNLQSQILFLLCSIYVIVLVMYLLCKRPTHREKKKFINLAEAKRRLKEKAQKATFLDVMMGRSSAMSSE